MEHENDTKGQDETAVKIKAFSAQFVSNSSEENLRPQISAPFYLHSMQENGRPPFIKPGKQIRPHILLGTIVAENDIVEIIGNIQSKCHEVQIIGNYLVKKEIVKNFQLLEKKFLISLFLEVIVYSAQRDFSAFKLACLLTIYLSTHVFFKWFYWSQPQAIWNYFKEIMIRHTIEDSPDGQEVFEPEECYDIMTHFHTIYMSNMPLVHMVTFGSHRLKLMWPFNPK